MHTSADGGHNAWLTGAVKQQLAVHCAIAKETKNNDDDDDLFVNKIVRRITNVIEHSTGARHQTDANYACGSG